MTDRARPPDWVRKAIERTMFVPWVDRLMEELRPSVRLHAKRGHVEVGGTRLGGDPDLLDDQDWPEDRRGRPLGFVGQVNLQQMRQLLPLSGSTTTASSRSS